MCSESFATGIGRNSKLAKGLASTLLQCYLSARFSIPFVNIKYCITLTLYCENALGTLCSFSKPWIECLIIHLTTKQARKDCLFFVVTRQSWQQVFEDS